MGRSQVLAGAVIGALAMVFANVAFSWFATGPNHYEWTDSAIFMSPVAAVFGAIVGALGALAIRITRPASRRRDDHHREKRKYRLR
ncbi:hypothetical protein [Kribbella sp. NBC_00889]|uniref:hypothetical protein n=1 Tax=Kribbella sp. NBC_00889 TaxID=2975974 RepID=UPI00386A50AD|nr:alkaline shock response membrane anchor protein AmaP [Kribbella sp. NBC_00889]